MGEVCDVARRRAAVDERDRFADEIVRQRRKWSCRQPYAAGKCVVGGFGAFGRANSVGVTVL
jgi:hypothetical protein